MLVLVGSGYIEDSSPDFPLKPEENVLGSHLELTLPSLYR
jgi:hypothetical protein